MGAKHSCPECPTSNTQIDLSQLPTRTEVEAISTAIQNLPAPTCPTPSCPAPSCPTPTCPAPTCPTPSCPAPDLTSLPSMSDIQSAINGIPGPADVSNLATSQQATSILEAIETSAKGANEPTNCYEWNGQLWQGSSPSMPTNTVCGGVSCVPCK